MDVNKSRIRDILEQRAHKPEREVIHAGPDPMDKALAVTEMAHRLCVHDSRDPNGGFRAMLQAIYDEAARLEKEGQPEISLMTMLQMGYEAGVGRALVAVVTSEVDILRRKAE